MAAHRALLAPRKVLVRAQRTAPLAVQPESTDPHIDRTDARTRTAAQIAARSAQIRGRAERTAADVVDVGVAAAVDVVARIRSSASDCGVLCGCCCCRQIGIGTDGARRTHAERLQLIVHIVVQRLRGASDRRIVVACAAALCAARRRRLVALLGGRSRCVQVRAR